MKYYNNIITTENHGTGILYSLPGEEQDHYEQFDIFKLISFKVLIKEYNRTKFVYKGLYKKCR